MLKYSQQFLSGSPHELIMFLFLVKRFGVVVFLVQACYVYNFIRT